jgi:hypothetical protein
VFHLFSPPGGLMIGHQPLVVSDRQLAMILAPFPISTSQRWG